MSDSVGEVVYTRNHRGWRETTSWNAITSLDLPTKPSKSRSSQAKPSHSQVCEEGKQNKAQITLLSITAAATEQSRAVCRAKLNLLNRSLFFWQVLRFYFTSIHQWKGYIWLHCLKETAYFIFKETSKLDMHMREQEQGVLPWLQLMHSSCKENQNVKTLRTHIQAHRVRVVWIRSQQGTAKAREVLLAASTEVSSVKLSHWEVNRGGWRGNQYIQHGGGK